MWKLIFSTIASFHHEIGACCPLTSYSYLDEPRTLLAFVTLPKVSLLSLHEIHAHRGRQRRALEWWVRVERTRWRRERYLLPSFLDPSNEFNTRQFFWFSINYFPSCKIFLYFSGYSHIWRRVEDLPTCVGTKRTEGKKWAKMGKKTCHKYLAAADWETATLICAATVPQVVKLRLRR